MNREFKQEIHTSVNMGVDKQHFNQVRGNSDNRVAQKIISSYNGSKRLEVNGTLNLDSINRKKQLGKVNQAFDKKDPTPHRV